MSDDSSNIGEIRLVHRPFLVKVFDSTIFIIIVLIGFIVSSYILFNYLPIFLPNYLSFPIDKDITTVAADIQNNNIPKIILKRPSKLIKSKINYYIFNISAPVNKNKQTMRLLCQFPQSENSSSITALDTLYFNFPGFTNNFHRAVRIKVPKNPKNDSNTFELKVDRLIKQDSIKWKNVITEKVQYTVGDIPYIFTIIWAIFSFIGFGEVLNIFQKIRKYSKKKK